MIIIHYCFQPWDDWFSREVMIHPLTNRPPHKRSFVPSKWEKLKVGNFGLNFFTFFSALCLVTAYEIKKCLVKQTTTKTNSVKKISYFQAMCQWAVDFYISESRSVLLNSSKQALSFVTIFNNTGRSDGPCPEDGLDEAIQASRRER